MLKFDQMQKWVGKDTYHRYYTVDKSPDYPGAIYVGPKNLPALTLFPNDEFIIHRIQDMYDNNGAKCAYICAMSYPVTIEKLRGGLFVNGALWYSDASHELRFDRNGDCLNQPDVPDDTAEKRKLFNKFMLNWQKQLSVLMKINPPETKIDLKIGWDAYHKLFLRTPCIDMFNYYVNSSRHYYNRNGISEQTIDQKINEIKNFRKRYQDALYAEYLLGDHPEITQWLIEQGLIPCEDSSQPCS